MLRRNLNLNVGITLVYAVGIILLLQTFAISQVTYVDTKAKGMGDSYQVALSNALKQAVSKVNGVSLEATTVLNTIEKTTSNEKNNKFLSSREFKEKISEQTKGSIKNFDIISESKDPNTGLMVIEVNATIAKYQLSSTAQRRRIAVVPFRLVVGNNSNNSPEGASLLNQSITNYLVQTRKFTVLDRNYDNEVKKELSNLTDKSNVEDQVKIGQMLFADYILVGRVESFEIKEIEKKYLTSDRVFESKKGIINFNYRVIDVPTKQIKFSSNYRKEINVKSQQQPIAFLADEAAKEVGLEIMYAIYPILIEKIENGNVYLGQGGGQINVGDIYDVYEMTPSKIKDSYTGENLGNAEIKVGSIKITDKNSKFSVAQITKSNYDLSVDFKLEKFIVKPNKNLEATKTGSKEPKKIDQKW
jgi:phosphopantetheinyl transferase (holo-ACP synthase)/TolB-like protein